MIIINILEGGGNSLAIMSTSNFQLKAKQPQHYLF